MRDLIKIFIIDLFLLIPIFAQENQIRFDHISNKQGLSQSTVFSIAQDSLGFMWFATQDGLNRYDGYNCKVYRSDPLDSNSVSGIGIRKLHVDRDGNLWIVSLNGKVDRFDQREERFFHYKFENKNDSSAGTITINSITEDNSGKIWIGSNTGKIFRYQIKTDTFLKYEFTFSSKVSKSKINLQCMYADKKGILWLGTWAGLISINPKAEKINRYIKNRKDNHSSETSAIFDIAEDTSGNLWIASINGGVSVFNKHSNTFKVYRYSQRDSYGISSDRVMSIYCDSRSNIWIGTLDKGINLYKPDEDKFLYYKYDPHESWSIGSGGVFSIFEDRGGCLWFGTSSSGVSKFDRTRQYFSQISYDADEEGSLSNNSVLAVCEDNSGKLWVGTDGGGLNISYPGKNNFKHYFQNPGSNGSNSITSIYQDKSGIVWIGTDPGISNTAGSVFTYNESNNTFSHFKKIKIRKGGVSTFLEDSYGNLWIGTVADGIKCYNKISGSVIEYKNTKNDSNSISGNSIFAIFEDSNHNLWFGTVTKGLNKFIRRNAAFKKYLHDPADPASISSNTVWCFAEDKSGSIWMGTWGGGLNKYDPGKETFRSFKIKDGLASNIIYGIIPDKNDLWISTSRGITKFNTTTYKLKNYDDADGLLNPEFNQGAYFKSKGGTLYFGGTKGVTFFNPAQIKKNIFAPSIVITDFRVFDKQIPLTESVNYIDKILLSYRQNFFSFEFTALDFAAPEKNNYAYKLEGIDKDWVSAGNRRFASYTDISPGEYIFKVKGSNNDGIWSSKEAIVSLIITPPFWQTWWFRFLVLLFISSILYLMHRYRLNRLLEVERTRIRIARDLHDDVSATITGMVYFSDAIENEIGNRKTPALSKLTSLIRESAENMQESMSDIIWSINPENDKWEIILPKFRRFASDLCESKGINYEIEIPDSISAKIFDMESRRNFWLIFKEIITNAVKHSDCTEIKISLVTKNDNLHLKISDNGKGFDYKLPSEGNGVKNIISRSKNLNGHAKLNVSPGNGTCWEIEIPLKGKR